MKLDDKQVERALELIDELKRLRDKIAKACIVEVDENEEAEGPYPQIDAGDCVRDAMISRIDEWLASCHEHHGTNAVLKLSFVATVDEWDDDDTPWVSISVESSTHHDEIEGRL